jgi:hypothetical protein
MSANSSLKSGALDKLFAAAVMALVSVRIS